MNVRDCKLFDSKLHKNNLLIMGLFDWLFGKSKKQLEFEEKRRLELWRQQLQKQDEDRNRQLEEERKVKEKLRREQFKQQREAEERAKQEVEALRKREAEKQQKVEQEKQAALRRQQVLQEEQRRLEKQRWLAEERQRQEKIQAEEERVKSQFLQLNFSSKRKDNCEDFARILQENEISTLYHFTDRANISSIREHKALLSWWYCEQNSIVITKPASDDTSKSLDRRYDLHDYVRLSFTPNHPMMYIAKREARIQDPIVLKINPEICFFEETKFSDMNATKTGHKCGQTLDDLKRIRFAVVRQTTHFDLSEEDKPHYQAEVLVKTRLPIEWITNINAF